MLTDFVCLYTYEFWLSLCKIVRSSVILLLPLFTYRTWIYGLDADSRLDVDLDLANICWISYNERHLVPFLYSNKNVHIKFSSHDMFLEWHSSGTLKSERLENQNNFFILILLYYSFLTCILYFHHKFDFKSDI